MGAISSFERYLDGLSVWLQRKYPTTITKDRYNGAYSHGGWLAIPSLPGEIDDHIFGDDLECSSYWVSFNKPDLVGRGDTPQEALDNLTRSVTDALIKFGREKDCLDFDINRLSRLEKLTK